MIVYDLMAELWHWQRHKRGVMRALKRVIVVLAAVPLLAGCPSNREDGGTGADAGGDIWSINDPQSTAEIDHRIWDDILATYLRHSETMPRRVDYEAFTEEDKLSVKAYLDYLGSIEITKYNREQQIAFWMNLYNAAMVNTVLDSMPVNSVLQIRGPGINVVGPWLKLVARVEGQQVSFNDIEHYILRPHFNDMGALVHYGLNCASMGCPSMAPRAHTAQNWRDNLDENARAYINSEHGLRFEDDGLYTSKIYASWFQEDFGGSDESAIAHLRQFARPGLAERLAEHSRILGDFYDWRLNEPDS